jgi:isoleucyl-tRNA synthetase
MKKIFPEYKGLDLPGINKEIMDVWRKRGTFEKSIEARPGSKSYIFYEGPPSANGIPGIHHVMARAIKDIFCRYKTMQGYRVERKAGWDTHGLPVELGVEKALGITKEDIGKSISISEYNNHCRKDVMRYTREWEDLTERMGYWVDMNNPYITYDNRYIETLWWLLKQLYQKDLLYKGYTIQPYSPAAGTGLSTHELNQPGCYRDVKDTTIVAQFKVIRDEKSAFLFEEADANVFFLAWTTTPWTLPSNTALAVGKEIEYAAIRTFNPYTHQPVVVVMASVLAGQYFPQKNAELSLSDFKPGVKHLPFRELGTFKGEQLQGIRYEQLIGWVRPQGDAFRVLTGDFVTTEDGTGIVHIAPTFGADDFRVARQNHIAALLVTDNDGIVMPLVDRKGRFIPLDNLDKDFVKKQVDPSYKEFAGRYVKNDYDPALKEDDTTVDVDIAVMLKKENKAFRIEKYEHNYPHCWRTDKPVLYYPLDSWFIRTTAMRERLMELNDTINWKPASTGTGRFGKWLENLVDWNLSRSRYWGTPLPIWVSTDRKEQICIGSVTELKDEIEKSVKAGFMKSNPLAGFVPGDNSAENYEKFDLHRPFVDEIVLVSPSGKEMRREEDLIDVWFDSGAMPYAQMHYPFEHKDDFDFYFPADFIAEGVDQTRGWFYTLHAISTMISDSVSFKNIISNGLILDKNGNKMSKRLGNTVDPFETIGKYGSDPLRWYMITNSQPWDNLKFDIAGVEECMRKFFGTLFNTYSFFALYANVDGFDNAQKFVPVAERPEIDRWILSLLNTLISEVQEDYENYEPTRAARSIQDFVTENLSNWYVRLNRKRFWGGEFDVDKRSAYQTLYTCLVTISKLAAPIAPFYMERLYLDLTAGAAGTKDESVHLAHFPVVDASLINKELEERMDIAQRYSSMILGLRRKVNIKVRQPLRKIMVPTLTEEFRKQFDAVKSLILSEVNVKEVQYISDTAGILVKKIKPNFKLLGPKYGKLMKSISTAIGQMNQEEIIQFEQEGRFEIHAEGNLVELAPEDVEIISEDIPGWLVANDGRLTVALDITITGELREEGLAREFINRIQNIRKESNFDVTDKIRICIQKNDYFNEAVYKHKDYIGSQTLAVSVELVDNLDVENARRIEIEDDIHTLITVDKIA